MNRCKLPSRRPSQSGFSLIESAVVLVTLVLLAGLVVPDLVRLTGGLRVRLAAAELSTTLHLARMYAMRHNTKVAVKFFTDRGNRVGFALYRDGDGDGVRTDDLRRGIDPLVTMRRDLSHLGGRVGFGFPAGLVPRDPGDPRWPMDRLDDPVRFGRSDLASFDSFGVSSPGSLYITDGYNLAAVRLYHRTAKISVLIYDRRRQRWR